MLNLNKDLKYHIDTHLILSIYKGSMFHLLDLAPLVVPQLALHDDCRLLIRDVVSLLPFRSPVLEPDFNLKIEARMISTIYVHSFCIHTTVLLFTCCCVKPLVK